MTRLLIALTLFVLAAYGAGKLRDGYRDRRMPTLFFGRINPLVFDRVSAPAFFWGVTVVNLAVVTGMALAGILILAVGTGK